MVMKVNMWVYSAVLMCLMFFTTLAIVVLSGGVVNAQTSECSCVDAGCGESQYPPTGEHCSAVVGTDPYNETESCACLNDGKEYTIWMGANSKCRTAEGGCCFTCDPDCTDTCFEITATTYGCAQVGVDPVYPCGYCHYTYSI